MHEISIAGAIIDAVLDAAGKNNAGKVNQVYLEIFRDWNKMSAMRWS